MQAYTTASHAPIAMRLAAFLLAALLLAPAAIAQTGAVQPSPRLTPEAVVRIQVEAMKRNDVPSRDAGIAVAFRFASPGNRQATGPLPRFAAMIRAGYPDLLGFQRAEYGDARISGDRAVQAVTLVQRDGRRVTYGFALSRQAGGTCDGCWMTDAVVERPEPPGGLQRI